MIKIEGEEAILKKFPSYKERLDERLSLIGGMIKIDEMNAISEVSKDKVNIQLKVIAPYNENYLKRAFLNGLPEQFQNTKVITILAGFSIQQYPSCCGIHILHAMQSDEGGMSHGDTEKAIRMLMKEKKRANNDFEPYYLGCQRIEIIDNTLPGYFNHIDFLNVLSGSAHLVGKPEKETFFNPNSDHTLERYQFNFDTPYLNRIAEKK